MQTGAATDAAPDVADAPSTCSLVGLWRTSSHFTRFGVDGRYMTSTAPIGAPLDYTRAD